MKDNRVEFMGSILKKNFQLIKKNCNNVTGLPCFLYSRKKPFHIDQKKKKTYNSVMFFSRE